MHVPFNTAAVTDELQFDYREVISDEPIDARHDGGDSTLNGPPAGRPAAQVRSTEHHRTQRSGDGHYIMIKSYARTVLRPLALARLAACSKSQ